MFSKKRETSNSIIEYSDNIVFVRVKENADLSIASMKEQFDVQNEMVKNDIYAVLIDGTNNVSVPAETRTMMANHQPPNRKATAIVSNRNLATLMLANFYLKVNKPKVHTKLFKNEKDAVVWLKSIISKKN